MAVEDAKNRGAREGADALGLCGRRWIVTGFLTALTLTLCVLRPAIAQTAGFAGIRLGDEVVPAADGYEAVSGKYFAAKATDIYISPFIWGGKVKNAHLNAGEPVPVLAKPKGYDWLLVGKDGAGIGYVPISAVTPAPR